MQGQAWVYKMSLSSLNLLIAFVVFIISLFPKADALQLFKLDALIEHYNYSQEVTPDLDFFSFLAEHYLELDHKDTEHTKLPLFHLSAQTVILFFINWANWGSLFYSCENDRPPKPFDSTVVLSDYISQCFHPPKN
ncbi:MAG: hypothetical protein RML72_07945 [Bacteroidia bacterium]|nr:hypothetical protein [Bacteroidia bacterium]MDW8158790.1 hypothetical protein [Bacteroidia bacterium]